MWLTAQQGLAIGVAFLLAGGAFGRRYPWAWAAGREGSIVMALYALWRLLGRIEVDIVFAAARRRGQWLWDVERTVGLGNERWLQRLVLPHGWLVQFFNGYYAIAHVPAMVAFLAWFWVRHRTAYPTWRTTLALSTAVDVVIRLIAVAPPRFFPELGFVDTAALYEQSVYGRPGTGVSSQLAAMPSIHVAWAALLAIALWRHGRRRARFVGLVHLVLTCLAVVVTANHWWLDGIVGTALIAPCWFAARFIQKAIPSAAPANDATHTMVRTR
jgi:hypothetical protein